MTKKILFIITKSEMGGAQRFLYELVTHLDRRKYDITVAFGGHGELFEKLRRFAFANVEAPTVASGLAEKNIKIARIRNFSNMPGIKNFLVFWEIFGQIKINDPDVLYLISSEAGFIGSLAGSFYRLIFWRKSPKIIYRIGGWAFKEPRGILIKKIYLWAERLSARAKDIIIVNSEFDRQLGIKNKIAKPKKIITIYNGVDINALNFLSKEDAIKFIKSKIPNTKYQIQNTILIGTIANLYKNKGLEFLILAVARIKKSQPNWRFMIIGEGPERQKLQKLIEKLELENYVILTGKISDAYRYLKAFDLFVLPSVKEGQPWVILEAMAAQIPIVATNIAGIAEMIDPVRSQMPLTSAAAQAQQTSNGVENEKSGLLVEPADSEALANAIEKILIHPSLAHELVKNSLIAIKENFNIAEMIRKNEELF